MCYKILHHFVDIPQDVFLAISNVKKKHEEIRLNLLCQFQEYMLALISFQSQSLTYEIGYLTK